MLTWLQDRCDDVFGRLALAAPEANVRKVLTITRLLSRFEVFDDVDTAVQRMR